MARFIEFSGMLKIPCIGGIKFDSTPGDARPSYSRNQNARIEKGMYLVSWDIKEEKKTEFLKFNSHAWGISLFLKPVLW